MGYKEFIDNIIETRGRVLDTKDKERHHILPKCLGGTNDPNNLIDLTLEEHFMAHKLLKEENPESRALDYAYRRMSNVRRVGSTRLIETPEEYREARLENKRRTHETNYGKELREETKRKISRANKGKKRTPEMCEANRLRQIDYYKTHEAKNKGYKHTEETKAKMREAHKHRDPSTYTAGNWSPEKKAAAVAKFKETYWAKPEDVRKEQTRKAVENREPVRYWQGKAIPQEMRDKISATLKEKHLCSPNARKVYCEETDTVYRSMTAAQAETGVDRHIILKYIRGERKDDRFHFKFIEATT